MIACEFRTTKLPTHTHSDTSQPKESTKNYIFLTM